MHGPLTRLCVLFGVIRETGHGSWRHGVLGFYSLHSGVVLMLQAGSPGYQLYLCICLAPTKTLPLLDHSSASGAVDGSFYVLTCLGYGSQIPAKYHLHAAVKEFLDEINT